ncbi:MAG: zinc ribbon domain-containing protein [Stygiobacter sp.]|nr:MAG: hypothetical protein A2X62_02850 [Stygiobacter sp. GWC2_38_9]OGV06498.1 MAG: hypothetical protein A2299_02220 [Stygiobacter sp. RIFOXYB2_FULL_37_11]OGV10560.1 MAG: hypothetical protein A2237_18675 [Stygiobacter sp. RIFOXYA2_FULL_38_8]OGV13241.1 MAG: hypothetical protein A2440_13000 [Stygiobacter sp. RIFOXYC2_FULL_38_25]OGV83287.1 MAG: hypothetical protein A2X65_16555 [Stygiobacter sp. GWF2_38_21]RJQ59272.1 MAG: zinc ribbon domain-containing protein [Stygiobacter sp.]
MALLQCPECYSKVSSLAKSCPKCGAPLSINNDIEKEITTVQLTSKKLKKQGCIFPILLIVIALMISQSSRTGAQIGVFLVLAAVIIYFVTKIQIWWHHK